MTPKKESMMVERSRPNKIWKLFLFSNAKQAKFQTEENKIKWQRSWLQEL